MFAVVIKRSSLHILLYITFCFSNFVSSECPNPGANPIVKYTGSHINISDVVACESVNRGRSLIVIQSFNTTNFDVDYHSDNESFNSIQPSLLIITPFWKDDFAARGSIYLNGSDGDPPEAKPSGQGRQIGKPGNPGGTAGSLFLIYGNNSNPSPPNLSMRGANGGKGQDGQDGRDGRNGTAKRITDDEDCTAWEDGWTKVWPAPNQCHEQTDSTGRCFAGSTGARWEIFGEDGERGEDGNDGGSGGISGKGGHYLISAVGAGRNTSIGTGALGSNGKSGISGKPGKGGRVGDSIIVTIGVEETPEGKLCGFLRGPINEPVERYAMDGYPGTDGKNSVGQKQPKEPFALTDFRPHIQSYLVECVYEAKAQENVELLNFCVDVRAHFGL